MPGIWQASPAAAPVRSAPNRPALLGSARSRILGWSVVLLAAAAGTSTVVTHAFLVTTMNNRISSELAHEIAEFQALAAKNGAVDSTAPVIEPAEDPTAPPKKKPAVTVLMLLQARTRSAVLEQDTVLFGIIGSRVATTSASFQAADGPGASDIAWLSRITGLTKGTVRTALGPARYEAVPVRIPGGTDHGVFVAAVLTAKQQADVNSVTRLQIEVGAIALLLGSALAWLMAGRVLRPVHETTALARRITETDLSERIPARGHDEISVLAVTFNRMLDRLEAALKTQREFLADAGHELRTPITVIQGNLDTLNVESADDAETLTIVAEEITRMSRLVDELVLLASSERPDFLYPERVDLAPLTRSLLAKARTLDDRPWVLSKTATGAATLDPQRVTQAIMQLAANAVAHTPAGAAVEIGSQISGGMVEFTVSDHGPGIPPEARERVFARFARLDPRRTAGLGLGLSIVAAIGAAHGGHVRVESRSDGTEATFRLVVPLEPGNGHDARPEPPQPGGRVNGKVTR